METIPFGHWPSPITPESMAAAEVLLDEVRVDGVDTYWLEGRPWEGGRNVLVRHTGSTGETADVVGPGWNVRSRVHEYGGGAYAVFAGTVVLVNFGDNRLYRVDRGGSPQPLTPADDGVRFGGLALVGSHVYAVREDHRGAGEPVNDLVRVDLHPTSPDDSFGEVVWSGTDFVSAPALSPDGRAVAVVTWDHPAMPWDSTLLRRADLGADGLPGDWRVVDGGEGVSVGQPTFGPDGRLWFVSDRSGWWNVQVDGDDGPRAAHALEADTAGAQWLLGMRDLAPLDDGRVVFRYWVDGLPRVAVLDATTGEHRDLPLPGGSFDHLVADGGEIAVRLGEMVGPPVVVRGPLDGPMRRLRAASDTSLPRGLTSSPEAWTWANSAGLEVHGLLLRPAHPDVQGPADALPPLVVMAHGGPTAKVEPCFKTGEQFWTSRGFAVLQVNYGGSTGWGRAYRKRLRGQWGVVDIDDCVTGALSLADAGIVERSAIFVRGGSAGGYVVLRAMTTSAAFAGGTSLFGVADIAALAADTHKFESRYCDGLVAPWPEGEQIYRERSPLHHVADLRGELLLLQGEDDHVVPLAQAQVMAAAMRDAGKEVDLVVYPGEGHGFRGRDAIVDAWSRELAFYQRLLERSCRT